MERILILDDDADNLQGIADILRSEHYSVLAVSTGLQAIESGESCGPISLFVTDMDLPHSSGTEIALKLVKLHPNLLVLFISGTPRVWWTRHDVSRFEQFTPNSVDFIEKPFPVSHLLLTVRNLIERRPQGRVDKRSPGSEVPYFVGPIIDAGANHNVRRR